MKKENIYNHLQNQSINLFCKKDYSNGVVSSWLHQYVKSNIDIGFKNDYGIKIFIQHVNNFIEYYFTFLWAWHLHYEGIDISTDIEIHKT